MRNVDVDAADILLCVLTRYLARLNGPLSADLGTIFADETLPSKKTSTAFAYWADRIDVQEFGCVYADSVICDYNFYGDEINVTDVVETLGDIIKQYLNSRCCKSCIHYG